MRQPRTRNRRFAGDAITHAPFLREAFAHAQNKEATPSLREHTAQEAYKRPPETETAIRVNSSW